MNLYGAWFRPLLEQDRPLGALVYRAIYAGFGLNPLPYRVVCFGLLAGNLVLLYAVAARLSSSRTVAALACLLGAYHAHLADLYYNTGTVYDLLCFALYWGAALAWMRGRPWVALALYAGALLSKEMAVTLPVVLAVYEIAQGRRAAWLRLLPMVVVTAAFLLHTALRPESVAAYVPHFSWRTMLENWSNYGSDLFYGAFHLTAGRILLLWAIVAAAAALLRTPDAVVAAVVIWVGLLPVVFIAPRGFYVMYLTLPGWYVLAARVLERATRRVHPVAVFALLAVMLVPLHAARREKGRWWVREAQASVRAVLEPLRRESLRKGARVLFVADPYPENDFLLTFIFRMRFRDDGILVERARTRPPDAWAYDRIYRVSGDGPLNWHLQIGE